MQGTLLATLVLLVQQRDLSVFGMDAQGSSSLVMAVMIGGAAICAFAVGRLVDRLPLRSTPLFPSLVGLAVGFALLAVAQNLPTLFLGVIVTSLSYNSITVPMMALLGDATSARQHGPAAAVFQWCGDVGSIIGPMLGI